MQEKTLGEIRVRAEFNPSNNDFVSEIKQKTAELIDLIQIEYRSDDRELGRLIALASTAYEEAAMWAVKAATCNSELEAL